LLDEAAKLRAWDPLLLLVTSTATATATTAAVAPAATISPATTIAEAATEAASCCWRWCWSVTHLQITAGRSQERVFISTSILSEVVPN
jgi:hypothetical protein